MGQRLREARREAGTTLEQLAHDTGLSVFVLRRLEAGERVAVGLVDIPGLIARLGGRQRPGGVYLRPLMIAELLMVFAAKPRVREALDLWYLKQYLGGDDPDVEELRRCLVSSTPPDQLVDLTALLRAAIREVGLDWPRVRASIPETVRPGWFEVRDAIRWYCDLIEGW